MATLIDLPVTLVIKAPNQKISDQTIQCGIGWTVKRLKQHLSEVYPSQPQTNQQRIIYSGKLLNDHLTLKDILHKDAKNEQVHTVHLVCPPGSEVDGSLVTRPLAPLSVCAPDQVNVNNHLSCTESPATRFALSSDDMTRLQAEYQAYLQQFYMEQMWAGYWRQMNTLANGVMPGTPQAVHARPEDAGQRVAEQPGQQQGGDNVGGGGMGGPMAGMLGGAGEDAMVGEGQQWDLLDWLLVLVRLFFLGTLIYYSFSSRAIIGLAIFVAVYLLQRNWGLPNNRNNPIPAPAPAPAPAAQPAQQPQVEQEGNEAEGEGHDIPQAPEVPPPDPMQGLRVVMETARQFFVTFFTSLIPERHPLLDVN